MSSVLAAGAMSGCNDSASRNSDARRRARSIQGSGYQVRVGDRGALSVDVNGESYDIESSYSYPDVGTVGTNELSWSGPHSWQLEVQQEVTAPEQIRIVGKAKQYTLTRTVSVEGDRIGISDEIVNQTTEPVGIVIRHRVVTATDPKEVLFSGAPWASEQGIAGTSRDLAKRALLSVGLLTDRVGYQAENPTLLVSLERSHLGLIAEDTLSRLQFEAHRYRAAFSMEHFAVGAQAAQTLKWALYPVSEGGDYFTFINRVRRDWKTNFTVAGPWDFFNLVNHEDLLDEPAKLESFLKQKRRRYQIVTFTPWLDYDNFSWRIGRSVNREEYLALVRKGVKAFKAIDPEIKCLGCVQSCWRRPPDDILAKLYELIPADQRKPGFYRFSNAQMRAFEGLPLAWKDSCIAGQDGRHIYELYENGPKNDPLIAIGVHATEGNSQFAYWMDQVTFIMEEAGLDGIYIDNFSNAFKADPAQRYTHGQWDGTTVDIDGDTGAIVRRYTDCARVGARAQQSLIQYVHSRSGTIVANTASAQQEVQSLPIMRFIEASGVMDHFRFVEGVEPPLIRHLCRAQLGSPIGLGWSAYVAGIEGEGPEYARRVMATAITYLRHGLLYYYYGHRGIQYPNAGSDSAEYGAINHMFPITPSYIGKGFVVGQERIVTCVSGKFTWKMNREPRVLCFDMENHPKQAQVALQKVAHGWEVTLSANNWREIYVVH